MQILREKIFEAARGLKESLNLYGKSPDQAQRLRRAERYLKDQTLELERARQQLISMKQELAELRARLAADGANVKVGGINPENVVWIFGTARTGSTWLASMMGNIEDHAVWREPYVGELFGRLYYNWVGERHFETKHFILGHYKESWLRSVRSFVLNEANARFPEAANEGYLVIKEPNGSVGAPLLMEALPESRMIFLIRDPRDVVASVLDATKKGSWLHQRSKKGGRRDTMFNMQTNTLVENTAKRYVRNIGNAREAYEKHDGYGILVRYEDLVAGTLGTMRRLYSELGIAVDEKELTMVVEKHAWENVPEGEKGEGKFRRKAKPGGWKEDLTPEQARTVEEITAPLLREFYPAVNGVKA